MKTVLVANRGEIAVRLIDGAHDMGLRAVAVYSDTDRDAPHVRSADLAVALHGTRAADTYLDVTKLLDAADRAGADAVHPGYGFLAENPAFARAVIDAGLTWIGPHPTAIERMGDKLAAKRLAAELGLPLLPSAELTGDTPSEWRAQAATVGYPLLVKAAAGGGGRGMRLVLAEDDLDAAVTGARREALGAFGDGTVFAERWLAAPRHVEIQVVADKHGHVLHLGERECSVQRRHQKLIEEAPSPAVDELLREQMAAAAIRLAEAIDYDNVGTVEFLLDSEHGTFFFLEMNTRLQVEHRVTEEVTGFDLVELQFRAAAGEAFDFEQVEIDIEGHAIEARLVAEDPSNDWLPSTGVLHRANLQVDDANVTVDSGVCDGFAVTADYDSLLAKVIASGDTRNQAINRLVRALNGMVVHGVSTNRNHLVAILDSDDFREGDTSTAFVDLHLTALDARPDEQTTTMHLLAAALWGQHLRRRADPHWAAAPSGWRNVGDASQHTTFTLDGEERHVSYRVGPHHTFEATIDDRTFRGRYREVLDEDRADVLLEVDGVAVTCAVHQVGDTWYVNSPDGQTDLVELPRFRDGAAALVSGGLTAPVPGRVVGVEVSIGDVVSAGQTLVVVEAMKVEHRVRAPSEGKIVDVMVATGDNVEAHQVLVQMEPVS